MLETQVPAPAGPLALRMYWRSLEPKRPVRCGARKLTTKRVVREPTAGLTVIRAVPVPEVLASAGTAAIASTAKDNTSFRVIVASLPRDPQPTPRYIYASGRLAQLGERRLDKAEVAGSSPASSIGPSAD